METIEQNKKELANSTVILVLGILSLIFCWCYGFVGLILGIVAVALAGTQRRIYQTNPELYTENSYKNINAGRTCGIIGICIAASIVVLLILFFVLVALGVWVGTLGHLLGSAPIHTSLSVESLEWGLRALGCGL